ncbi:MAG: Ig-like domain-containing protein [Pseudomonadales bacterium]
MSNIDKMLLVCSIMIIYGCSGGSDSDGITPPVVEDSSFPPIATDDAITANSGEAAQIDVLANDSDADGDSLTISEVSAASNGTTEISGDQVTYTSDDGFLGTDSFTYTVSDGEFTSTASVDVEVQAVMSLSGRIVDAPIANATVTVTIGDTTYTATADADGFYALDIAFSDGNELLTINAEGSEDNDQAYVNLVSALSDLASLLEAAGEDGVLARNEAAGTNVTNVTTASYVLATEANGGTPPTTREELITAEEAIDPATLLEVAAVIKLIIDDPNYDLPEGKTNIREFVEDKEAYNTVVAEVEADDPAILDNVVKSIVADDDLVVTDSTSAPPEFYIPTSPTQPGFIGKGSEVLVFNTDGTGAILNRFFSEQGNSTTFTWTLDADGFFNLDYTMPVQTTYFPIVVTVTDDAAILAAYDGLNITQATATDTRTGSRFKVITRGNRTDVVQVERTSSTTYEPVVYQDTTYQIPDKTSDDDFQTAYVNGDNIEFWEVEASDVVGTWSIPVLGQLPTSGARAFSYDLVTFNEDGSFSSELKALEGTWTLAGSTVEMTYGDASQTVEVIRQIDHLYGALIGVETEA